MEYTFPFIIPNCAERKGKLAFYLAMEPMDLHCYHSSLAFIISSVYLVPVLSHQAPTRITNPPTTTQV